MQSARSNFAGANLLDLLQSQLKIKQLEISSLLEITQAINNNLPAADLFRVYELTMLGQMKVQRLLLFSKNEGWEVVSSISADKNKHGIDVGNPPFAVRRNHRTG